MFKSLKIFIFLKQVGRKEKPYLQSCRTSQYEKKQSLLRQCSPNRIMEASIDIKHAEDRSYRKKICLVENVEVKDLSNRLQEEKVVSADEAIKMILDMELSERQYGKLLKLMKSKKPGLFPSIPTVRSRKQEIIPEEVVSTSNFHASIDFAFSIRTVLKRILSLVSFESDYEDLELVIKLGNKKIL